MQTITHTNPDGSTVDVTIGNGVAIGDEVRIGKVVEIGNGVTIGDEVKIDNCAVVCRQTSVCEGVRIPELYTVPQDVVAVMPHQTVHVIPPSDQEA